MTLRGTKTLLIGSPGAGKTFSLSTAIEAGLELFVIGTEPGFEESLMESIQVRKLPVDKFHYQYIASASQSWDTMMKMAKFVTTMSYADLTEIKNGIEKSDHQQFTQLLGALKNFTDERTGTQYGPVDSWGATRMLCIDSLSGINTMAMDLMVGAKPAAHQGEWGVAMNIEEKLVKKLCSDLDCFFTLTAHIEKEFSEVRGNTQLMVGALGRKLAPKLPKDFSDVVHAYKEGNKFYWATLSMTVDLKNRNLPLQDKLQPSFVQIVETWSKRGIATQPTEAQK